MSDELIAHMRARIDQMRKIKELAHDPRMIEIIDRVIETGEADIKRLQAKPDSNNPAKP